MEKGGLPPSHGGSSHVGVCPMGGGTVGMGRQNRGTKVLVRVRPQCLAARHTPLRARCSLEPPLRQALAVVYERKLEQQAGKLQAGELRTAAQQATAREVGARRSSRQPWGGSLGWIDEAFDESFFGAAADQPHASADRGGEARQPKWRQGWRQLSEWRRRRQRGGAGGTT